MHGHRNLKVLKCHAEYRFFFSTGQVRNWSRRKYRPLHKSNIWTWQIHLSSLNIHTAIGSSFYGPTFRFTSRQTSVVSLRHEMENQGIGIRFRAIAREFSLLHILQPRCGAQQDSCVIVRMAISMLVQQPERKAQSTAEWMRATVTFEIIRCSAFVHLAVFKICTYNLALRRAC